MSREARFFFYMYLLLELQKYSGNEFKNYRDLLLGLVVVEKEKLLGGGMFSGVALEHARAL